MSAESAHHSQFAGGGDPERESRASAEVAQRTATLGGGAIVAGGDQADAPAQRPSDLEGQQYYGSRRVKLV